MNDFVRLYIIDGVTGGPGPFHFLDRGGAAPYFMICVNRILKVWQFVLQNVDSYLTAHKQANYANVNSLI